MTPTGATGPNNLEIRLVFTSDPSRASQAMKALEADAQKLSRSAQAAQRDVQRVGQGGAGGTYALAGGDPGGTYGVNYNRSGGQSKAHAYAASYQPDMPGGRPGAVASRAGIPPTARPYVTGGAADGGLGDFLKVGLIVGAVTTVVDSLGRFATALDKAAVTTAPGGARIDRPHTAAFVSAAADNSIFRSALNLADYAGSEGPDWDMGSRFFRFIGRYEKGDRRRAGEAAYQAQLEAGRQDPRWEMQAGLEDIRRKNRALGLDADAGSAIAATVAFRAPGFAQRWDRNPAGVMAEVGQIAAGKRFDSAQRAFSAAEAEAQQKMNAAQAAAEARDRVKREVAGPGAHFATFAAGIPTMALEDRAGRQRLINAEVEALQRAKEAREAINRLEAAGITLAEKKLAVGKANAAHAQAELGLAMQKREQQESGLLGFAEMDFWAKQNLVDLSKKFKEGGWGSLTHEEKGQLRPYLTPENRDKTIDYQLRNDNQFAAFQRNLGQQDRAALDELIFGGKKPEQGLLFKANFQAVLNEAEMTRQLEKLFNDLNGKLTEMVEKVAQGKWNLVEEKMQQARTVEVN